MRRVPVSKLEAGMSLAKTLLNERGDALLTAETSLTNPYIALLREKGFKVRRLEDGMPEWRAAGLPVVEGSA